MDAYDQVADNDLEDLSSDASSARKEPLKNADQQVAKGSTNECSVDGHFGYPGGKVMAVPISIVRDP